MIKSVSVSVSTILRDRCFRFDFWWAFLWNHDKVTICLSNFRFPSVLFTHRVGFLFIRRVMCRVSCQYYSVFTPLFVYVCSFLHFLQKNKLYPDDSSLFNYQLFPKPKLWPLTRKTHPDAKIIQEGIPLAYICIHLHNDWTLKSWPRNLFASRIFFTLFFLERACNWLWSRFTVSLIW